MLSDMIKKNGKIIILGVLFFLMFISGLSICRPILKNWCHNQKIVFRVLEEKEGDLRGTTVRIKDVYVNEHYPINLKDVNLSEGWSYYPDPEMLVSDTPGSELEINLENVYFVSLRLIGSNSSGFLEVDIDSKTYEIDLHRDSEWEAVFIDVYDSFLILPEKHVAFLGIVFAACMLASYVIVKVVGKTKNLDQFENNILILVRTFLIAVILVFCSELIVRGEFTDVLRWIKHNLHSFILITITIWISINSIVVITKKEYLGVMGLSLVLLCLAMASAFKIEYRGTPVTPWDLQLISVLMSVIGGIKFHLTKGMTGGLLIIAVLNFIVIKQRRCWNQVIKLRCAMAAFIVGTLMFHLKTTYIQDAIGINQYQLETVYSTQGVANTFLYLLRYTTQVKAPDGYDSNALENIIISEKDNDTVDTIKPNVLIILGESYWDVSRIPNIIGSKNPLKNYNQLKQETLYGEAMVNVFGGGTVNSEWEVLTGFSSMYLPTEYMPYTTCVQKKNDFSIIQVLKNKGYRAFAIHPYLGSNYNRNVAYANLGIEKFLTEDDFDENTERIRGFISDKEVYKRAFSEGEKYGEDPWVGVLVTMQNHGGYAYSPELQKLKEEYPLDLNLEDYANLDADGIYDMMCGVKAKDEALNVLKQLGEESKKPTLIIYFGDHMVDSQKGGLSLLDSSDLYDEPGSDEANYQRHKVPFFIWSNYAKKSKDLGIVGLPQLLPIACTEYNMDVPKFWEFLVQMRSDIGACFNGLYIDKQGETKKVSEMNDKEKEWYMAYEVLQYDYLFGKKYFLDWFQ